MQRLGSLICVTFIKHRYPILDNYFVVVGIRTLKAEYVKSQNCVGKICTKINVMKTYSLFI